MFLKFSGDHVLNINLIKQLKWFRYTIGEPESTKYIIDVYLHKSEETDVGCFCEEFECEEEFKARLKYILRILEVQ